MRVLIIIGLVLVIALVALVADLYGRRSRQPVRPGTPAEFKNHQDMARWIERALHDDLIRASLPAAEQERARRLLGEFYGDTPNELP